MRRNRIAVLLAASLLAGALAGCSGTGGSGGTNVAGPGGETAGTAAADTAMGRYVESNIELPVQEGGQVLDVIQVENGALELYSRNGQETARYIYRDGGWEKQEKSLLEGITIPFGTSHLAYGEDQNRYLLYPSGQDYHFELWQLAQGSEPRQLLKELLTEQNDRGYAKLRPDFLAVDAGGNLILSHSRESGVYSPDGELLFSMPQEMSSMDWKNTGYLDGTDFVTFDESGFLRYDLSKKSGISEEQIPFQSSKMDSYSPIAPDGSGGMYLLNEAGIHHFNKGGSIWETVVDGSLNSLSLPSANLKKLFVGNDNDYFVWFSDGDTELLRRYTYDAQIPSVPSETLTIYGLDLSDSSTIRQAASLFQLSHPNTRVELIDGQSGAGSTTVSDTVRALNTELLGGNGADILVLDGLPVNSYIEKGVLLDLNQTLEPMISTGQLMENVVTPFTEEDGGLYQIPSRMTLMAVYGDQGAIDSLSSMSAMRAYQSDPSHLPLRPKTKYENLLRQVILLTYNELVDAQTGRPSPGKIQELLETVKVLGEANGAKVAFDNSEDGGFGEAYNRSFGTDGLMFSEYDRLDRDMTSLAVDKYNGLFDTMMAFAVLEKRGLTMEGVNGAYLPNGILGINAASARKEQAQEFIRFVLGGEIQNSDLGDGFPVNAAAAVNWVEHEDKTSSMSMVSVGGDDGYEISGSYPDQEKRGQLYELAKQSDRPIVADRILVEIIVNEAMGYFEGSKTLEQAAQNADNKAGLYFSE